MKTARQFLFFGTLSLTCSVSVYAFQAEIEQDPTDGNLMKISWPAVVDRQYQVYSNDSFPVGTSNPVGSWMVRDDDDELELVDQMGSNAKQFYSVVERTQFEIDVSSFGYATSGNTWTYTVVDSRDGNVPFTAVFEAKGLKEFPDLSGQMTYRVKATSSNHPRDNDWSQILYISSDFSNGLYQVGGKNQKPDSDWPEIPRDFEITSTAKQPLILNGFTPNVAQDADYTHDFFGPADNTITHSIATNPLSGADGDLPAIQVTSNFTVLTDVIQPPLTNPVETLFTYTITDIYVPEIGLVSKVVNVVPDPTNDAFDSYAEVVDVSYTLDSYTRVP